MRVLVVKMSSLGDVLHTLPALTDAHRHHPDLRADWVVEEAFAHVPAWHPAVRTVISAGLRRWRHAPVHAWRSGEWQRFRDALANERYDRVIDAQGLMKSALVTRFAKGDRFGFDRSSAREPLAAMAYDHSVAIDRRQHAIRRLRQLFAAALDYPFEDTAPQYGIEKRFPATRRSTEPYLIFFHGTTWATKLWPLAHWQRLVARAGAAGYSVRLPWASVQERLRAERLARESSRAEVLPEVLSLNQLARLVRQATAVVGVDTGLVHLAAALGVPSVTVYGATDPELTGTVGDKQHRLRSDFPCAPCRKRMCQETADLKQPPPCYGTLTPERVWQTLEETAG